MGLNFDTISKSEKPSFDETAGKRKMAWKKLTKRADTLAQAFPRPKNTSLQVLPNNTQKHLMLQSLKCDALQTPPVVSIVQPMTSRTQTEQYRSLVAWIMVTMGRVQVNKVGETRSLRSTHPSLLHPAFLTVPLCPLFA